MCFDCLVPKVSADKAIMGRLSRQNTSGGFPPDGYGPPLKFSVNPEDLPDTEGNHSKEVKEVENVESSADSSGSTEDGTESEDSMETMDPYPSKERNKSIWDDVQKTKPREGKFVYEQDIEVELETKLDDQLPSGENTSSEVTSDTLSTVQWDQKLEGQKMGQPKNVAVGQLEVVLEYDESLGRLKVAIWKASGLANKKQGCFSNYRIRFSLRPNKERSCKTRMQPVESAVFRELFRFRDLPKEELPNLELHFILQGCRKYSKEKMVGEASLNLSEMEATTKRTFDIPIVRKYHE